MWLLRALAAVMLCTSAARAATYYVSPGGSDRSSGLSRSAPWKTLVRVNAATFSPGDRILFQRGGQWRESLAAASSGASGRPIVYADYGRGDKPKFWGSVLLDNARFFPLGGMVYGYKIDVPVHAALADHVFLFDALGQPVETLPRSYSWSRGLLKINAGGRDPRADGRVYTVCVREDVISSNGKSHLTFRNLAADESANLGGGYGVRIMDSADVRVEGCEAFRAGKHHFGCINSTQVVFRDCYAAYAMPHQGHGGHSAFVSFGDNKNRPGQTSEYDHCVFAHPEDAWDGQNHYYIFVAHGPTLKSVLLRDMISRGGGWSVDNTESGAVIKIQGGLLENNRLELYGSRILVDGLHVTGAQGTVDISASDCILQNMLIRGTNLGTGWYQTAVLSRRPGNTVRFCKIVMAPDAPDFNACLAVAESGTQFRYYGNVFVSNGPAFRNWAGSVAEAHDNAHILSKKP